MIKVIIVDDQIILRESLKFIIEQDKDISVIGCAGDGLEALELCRELLPDIVLMDIIMPICDGIFGTRLIKNKYGDSVKVLILTTFNDDENINKAMNNGADGYILKNIMPKELISAVKSTSLGLGVFHQSTVKTVMKKKEAQKSYIDFELTEKEKSIIKLIVDGRNNKEIASELYITEGTVKNSITGILEKMKLRDRTQLAVFAIKNNLD